MDTLLLPRTLRASWRLECRVENRAPIGDHTLAYRPPRRVRGVELKAVAIDEQQK